MTSAEYIQNFREQYHLSRNQLAFYTGCSANLVARLENGAEPSREWWDSFRDVYARYDAQEAMQEEAFDFTNEVEMLVEEEERRNLRERAETVGKKEAAPALQADDPARSVREARRRHGLSSSELAELLGVSRSRVSQMEHGKISGEQAASILAMIERTCGKQEEILPG